MNVLNFGGKQQLLDPRSLDKSVVGGKGANLAEMSSIGLPIPPGFTISTEECLSYLKSHSDFSDALIRDVADALAHIEENTGKMFGDANNPLLVSVRSGAAVSMPGMMDTVLNLGLNDQTVQGLATGSNDARFAWDCYRRFIQMYSTVVLGIDYNLFERAIKSSKQVKHIARDTDMTASDWKDLVSLFKQIVSEAAGYDFPQDVNEQLWGAIRAVFESWDSERAKIYRRLNNIPPDLGTAVNVQAMVFGNMGDTSATGVAFTRDPASGERTYYGEYLINAQGEDVVAGIRTPQYLTKAARLKAKVAPSSMEEAMPEVFSELSRILEVLEQHYKDMQDIEFTVECGKLWLLQTRSGKRAAKAAIKVAVDMVREGLISQNTAILRIDPATLDQLLHPMLDPDARCDLITTGLPASPGAASGAIVLDANTAESYAQRGEKAILVRVDTSPEDIHGMHAAVGILTALGGMTSHAAVVARGMGRPCVSGAGELSIDLSSRCLLVNGRQFLEGETVTIDGSSGRVMAGVVATIEPELDGDFTTLMGWGDHQRRMKIRANAETPADCRIARQFGAEGIGLCRTEHMFFDATRIMAVRETILAEDEKGRRRALAKLLAEQRSDFRDIFNEMDGLPCTIRLLDPPLHEFLPHSDAEFDELAAVVGIEGDRLRHRAQELREFNPMLGHRGCRLGISYPEIYEMQVRAIFEAACGIVKSGRAAPITEVMIPLVSMGRELDFLRTLVDRVAHNVFSEQRVSVEYSVGTMIELPRAALIADEIAERAEFFSFGTNDLTQTTLGISRDDAGRFLSDYLRQGIIDKDPFVSLDTKGVGQLIALAAERGRTIRKNIKLGICGEHGGDPASIAFCERIGLNYVSVSPYRIPIARLAAAQAAMRARSDEVA